MALGKVRVARKATKGKGKSWRKGFSSSSNPETRKFREEAKNRFFSPDRSGQGNLTEAALAQHNNLQKQRFSDSDSADDDAEVQSIGAKTFDTFASSWSDCTNVSFNRLFRNWNASSALHKEMLAVLAAVTEVIKSKGGKETETEYFAALMTTLETVDSMDATSAVVNLLGMVIKRLPPSVLKLKFSDAAKVFVALLSNYMNSEHTALLRALLGCLSVLLRAQEAAVWGSSSTLKIYESLLVFVIHPKPKVRKAAQHAVCAILKGSSIMLASNPPSHHPAALATAKFCTENIERCGGSGATTTTLHILVLLKEILCCFPHAQLKTMCETILRVMTLGNTLITSQSLQAFYGMFSSHPKPDNLPTELCAQIIMALYDYQPNIHDAQPLITWLSVMKVAFEHLYGLNENLCITHLPKFFGIVVPCWLSDKKEMVEAVTMILKSILYSCIQPSASLFGEMVSKATYGVSTPAHKIFQTVENALKYQYHAAWGDVLQVLAVVFEVLGKQCHSIMTKCLQSLSDLRESLHFAYTVEVDRAIGSAVKSMGPEIVLQAIPIHFEKFEESTDFPRSWLLPIIRDNAQQTRLGFFIKYFLPVAVEIKKHADKMEKEGRAVEAKTFDVIQQQIWSTLPGFCTEPTDLVQSFKTIAKTLGMALNERADIRPHILTSLRVLINKNKSNDANRAELSRFAKNYLPIFFNLYTQHSNDKHEEETRLAVLETAKVYLQITDTDLCNSFVEKSMKKLQSADSKAVEKHSVMDLMRILLPYISKQHIKSLYELCEPLLMERDRTIQKKAYRIIEELCKSNVESCQHFVQSNLPMFQKLLFTTLSSSSPPSKAPRLRALCHIVHQLTGENKDFVIAIIPEAVLCTKETAEKPRMAAFNLLVEIGHFFERCSDDKKTAIKEYTQLLLGGLAGSTHMASASTLALCKLMHDFKDNMPFNLIQLLIESIVALLTSRHREVVQSAIFFVKTLMAVLKPTDLEPHAECLVKNLCSIPQEHYRHFRFKAKEIFVKLVRKFGHERISKLMPESHQKILRNIRKVEARKARQRPDKRTKAVDDVDLFAVPKPKVEGIDEVLEELDDELMDDIDESNVDKSVKKRTRQKEASAWIEEKGDEIVDFLDPSINKKLRATNPFETKTKKESEFKMTKDGKLIIEEEDDNDGETRKSKKGKTAVPDLEDHFPGIEISPQKRKIEDDSDVEDYDPSQYQAGGSGIHRAVKKKRNTDKPAVGAEYRGKKAAGDIKKKGKPDPYSYIPLDRKALNRRKRSKLSGQFKGIVRAAKMGAQRGAKAKRKRQSKNS